MSNIAYFDVVRSAGLKSFNFLVPGLRQSVSFKLRCNVPNLKATFDLEKFKCRDYYYLIKQKYERPSKWRKLKEEFNLEDKSFRGIRDATENCLMNRIYAPFSIEDFKFNFIYNWITLQNRLCFKSKLFLLPTDYRNNTSYPIWMSLCDIVLDRQILNKLQSCESLTPEYRDIILGLSKEKIYLLNYILILGKSYLWTCRCNRIKLSLSHFKRILINFKLKGTTL